MCHQLELAEIRFQILALIRRAKRVAEAHARVGGPQMLVERVRDEDEPEELPRVVLPGPVGVVRLVVPVRLETPRELLAPADVIEEEPRAARVSGESGANETWKLGHGASPERGRLWRAWEEPLLKACQANARAYRLNGRAARGGRLPRCSARGSRSDRNATATYKPVHHAHQKPSIPAIFRGSAGSRALPRRA